MAGRKYREVECCDKSTELGVRRPVLKSKEDFGTILGRNFEQLKMI